MTDLYRKNFVKTGLAKISGGVTEWGVPGSLFSAVGTSVLTVNEVRYSPFTVRYPVTITANQFEVTAGPASDANVRVGIYLADSEVQPTGAPVYDSGSIVVATAFTGLKTTTGLTVSLRPGTYLMALNCDVAMTVRTVNSPSPTVLAAMGANAVIQRMAVAQAYGAFPTPGTKWTAVSSSTGTQQNPVVFQWTE